MTLLSPLVLVIIFIELLLTILAIGIFLGYVKIFRFWEFNSFEPSQYKLENINYLLSISGKIVLAGKMIVILLIIYVTDSMSSLITGAMCAAGVFDSVDFSDIMLFIKLLSIFFIMLWFLLDIEDLKRENFPFIRIKAIVFFIFTVFIIFDLLLLTNFFLNIDSSGIVRCCSTIYSSFDSIDSGSGGIFSILRLSLFILFSIFLILIEKFKSNISIIIMNIIFFIMSLFMIIHFFSPYIYELPTHNCPFCIFKPEYNYIGYPIFILLIGGSFSGIYFVLMKKMIKDQLSYLRKISMSFKMLFIFLVMYFPIMYYIKNGVFL